jgi:hypothetical protein
MYNKIPPGGAISDLTQLNQALMRLEPAISGIDSGMLGVRGATLAMINDEIANNVLTLYDGIKRADVLKAIGPGVTERVDTHPITTCTDDVHGDKHFPGGLAGTKFTVGAGANAKKDVNEFLKRMILPLRGRIRRDANGTTQPYYLTERPNDYTNGQNLVIQVDYVASRDAITFHGYPDANVRVYSLSRTKGGQHIR